MTQEQIDALAAEQAAQLQARKDDLTAQIADLQAQLAAL
jgi:cell division protein FtsB